jgi:uncharacterized protein
MAIQVNSLTNANIYADGSNFIGRAKEIQLPEVAFKQVDHEALGMVGMTELFAGIEKMEATIMWNSAYPDALRKFSNPNAAVQLQARANMRIEASTGLVDEVAVVIDMTARPKNMPGYNFKQHENVELETKLNITYISIKIDGEVISEVDILANIFKVGGVDLLAKYRANTGA